VLPAISGSTPNGTWLSRQSPLGRITPAGARPSKCIIIIITHGGSAEGLYRSWPCARLQRHKSRTASEIEIGQGSLGPFRIPLFVSEKGAGGQGPGTKGSSDDEEEP
jgi:hypothetical protein